MSPTNAELERLFAEHRIPIRRLYPWWYRLYRRCGLELRPPLLFTFAEHVIYEGSSVAVIAAVAAVDNACCMTTPMRALIPIFALVPLVPLWNWWSYRRLRRRLGV